MYVQAVFQPLKLVHDVVYVQHTVTSGCQTEACAASCLNATTAEA